MAAQSSIPNMTSAEENFESLVMLASLQENNEYKQSEGECSASVKEIEDLDESLKIKTDAPSGSGHLQEATGATDGLVVCDMDEHIAGSSFLAGAIQDDVIVRW